MDFLFLLNLLRFAVVVIYIFSILGIGFLYLFGNAIKKIGTVKQVFTIIALFFLGVLAGVNLIGALASLVFLAGVFFPYC